MTENFSTLKIAVPELYLDEWCATILNLRKGIHFRILSEQTPTKFQIP